MVDIERGMTPQQVVDALGPPLDFLDMAALVGSSRSAGPVGRASDAQLRNRRWWLYRDVPRAGVEINISFRNGRVVEAREHPYDLAAYTVFRHDWARAPVLREIARVAGGPAGGRLSGRPGWRRLGSAPVMEFVLTAYAYPTEPDEVGRAARRFGELDVIVSLFETTAAERMRATMPGGYVAELRSLADRFGLLPRRLDLAHWVIGRGPGGGAVAHLAFLPADGEVAPHYPGALVARPAD